MRATRAPSTRATVDSSAERDVFHGATHLAAPWNTALSAEESTVARVLGARVARIAQALAALR